MAATNCAFRTGINDELLYNHIERFNAPSSPIRVPKANQSYQDDIATGRLMFCEYGTEPSDEHLYNNIQSFNKPSSPASEGHAANQTYQDDKKKGQQPTKDIGTGRRMLSAMIAVFALSVLTITASLITTKMMSKGRSKTEGSQCCCVSNGMRQHLSEIKQAINDWKVNQTGESEVFRKEKQQLCLIGQEKNATRVNHTDKLRLTSEKVQQIHAELQVKQNSKVNQTEERRMFDKVLQWMTAELKQEIRASKVNQTGERRVFDEALQRMTAELKQEIRATKVNQTVEVPWIKMKTPPVCFGARDNTFGSFVVPSSGKLVSVKLVHVYGYVTCDKRNRAYWSFWGCCHYPKDVNVVITTSFDKILLPSNEFFTGLVLKRSSIPGYNSLSPELVLSAVSNPLNVAGGQELRLWYGQDLANSLEGNNGGTSCCDVYVRLI